MNIGDRFKKDGKLVEVTSVNDWGYGFKYVTEVEELPEDTVFDFPAESEEEVKEEVKPIEVPVEKPKKVVRRRRNVKQ